MDTLEENLHQLLPSKHHALPYANRPWPTSTNTKQAYPHFAPFQREDALEGKLEQKPLGRTLPKLVGDRGIAYGEW